MAIDLQKGQRIDLRKQTGSALTNFCVGVNWGAIESKGFLGFSKNIVNVDLDLSCVLLNSSKQVCDHLYSPLYRPEVLQKFGLPMGKLSTREGALRHSGDDLSGDSGGDDGLDNEIITVDLASLSADVEQIFFFLNNVGKEDFAQIPFAKIRMYEGSAKQVREVFASYNVASDAQYAGRKALIMGKLYRKNGEWKFNAIGDATSDVFFGQTIQRILQSYA